MTDTYVESIQEYYTRADLIKLFFGSTVTIVNFEAVNVKTAFLKSSDSTSIIRNFLLRDSSSESDGASFSFTFNSNLDI